MRLRKATEEEMAPYAHQGEVWGAILERDLTKANSRTPNPKPENRMPKPNPKTQDISGPKAEGRMPRANPNPKAQILGRIFLTRSKTGEIIGHGWWVSPDAPKHAAVRLFLAARRKAREWASRGANPSAASQKPNTEGRTPHAQAEIQDATVNRKALASFQNPAPRPRERPVRHEPGEGQAANLGRATELNSCASLTSRETPVINHRRPNAEGQTPTRAQIYVHFSPYQQGTREFWKRVGFDLAFEIYSGLL